MSALQFVRKRLREAGLQDDMTPEETAYVERLGGRASDLSNVRLTSLQTRAFHTDAFCENATTLSYFATQLV